MEVAPKSKVFFVGLAVLGVVAMVVNATAAWFVPTFTDEGQEPI